MLFRSILRITTDAGDASATAPHPRDVKSAVVVDIVVESGKARIAVGELNPTECAEVEYRAIVTPSANVGRLQTRGTGVALSPARETTSATSAELQLFVLNDPFITTQVVIGRVFEDRNHDGVFNSGEPGVANVRVVSDSGLSATTDTKGDFTLPAIREGSLALAQIGRAHV